MANSFTTYYNLTKPEVGADTNAWGGHLNGDLDVIDATMNTISGVASAALPKAGGTMTGNITFAAGQPTATTSAPGIVQLTDSTSSTSATTAATPNSVKTVADSVTSLTSTVSGVSTVANAALPKAGGTMTGDLSIISGTTEMKVTLGSSGGYYFGNATVAGFKNSGGTARVSWNISTGDFTAAGNVTAYSDARLKDNVETIRDAVALVRRLRGVFYDRIDTGEHGVGVIAQETREVIPQVVKDNDGTLSVAYGNLVGVLIEAVKELSARIEALEGK